MAIIPEHKDVITSKILVVGHSFAGKSSIIRRTVHGTFSTTYKTTIGVDFAMKFIDYNERLAVRLQLWDIVGQDRFANITRAYYRDAVAAFVVFDITDRESLNIAALWKSDLDEKISIGPNKDPIPVILLANKCDIDTSLHCVKDSELSKYATEHNFSAWYVTSAKDNTGVEEAMLRIASYVVEQEQEAEATSNRKEPLDELSLSTEPPKKGCCD